jgi:phenylacetate-CoA ligase
MIYDHPLISGVYRLSPILAQNMLVSTYGLLKRLERKGHTASAYNVMLRESQFWPAECLREYQDELLRRLIQHAYENVPYYRRVFDELRLNPGEIRTAMDLYKLPVLRKDDVRRFNHELQARNVPSYRATVGRTGGTTGIPLRFLLDKDRVIFDRCLTERQWNWAGYRPGDKVVVLRGLTLIPQDTHTRVYWRFDWADNRIYLSGFHISRDTAPLYIRKLQEWRPQFIAAYPSSAYTLARFMEQEGVIIPVRALFTSSEVLSPAERNIIERQFACKVWDRYGTGERLAVSQQCEQGSYHQNSEFGIMQVDSPMGQPAPIKTKGEVVQTGLTNYSMPLIRYAIGDGGYLQNEACSCGRSLPGIGPMDGRKDDVIVTADGRLMPRAGLDQVYEFVKNLERCQLVQERIGEVIVRVLPRPGFGVLDEGELKSQLHLRLGAGTEVIVQVTDNLLLTAAGKERFIISKVDLNQRAVFDLNPRTD